MACLNALEERCGASQGLSLLMSSVKFRSEGLHKYLFL